MSYQRSRPFSAEIQLIQQNDTGEATAQAVRRPPAFSGQAEILAAIAELRQELFRNLDGAQPDSGTGAAINSVTDKMLKAHGRDIDDAKILKAEIEQLSAAIDTTKREIAAVRYKDVDKRERIIDVTHELDEVVLDTECATDQILSNCEAIENHLASIELQATSADERAEIAAVGEKVVKIYEACNFQDITGQRITKVVNTLKFIEQRLDAMMLIWGGQEEFEANDLPIREIENEDHLLLNGPARASAESVSQDEIDALFD